MLLNSFSLFLLYFCLIFLTCVVFKFFFFAFILTRRRFVVNLTIFKIIDFLISIFRVFLVEFEVVALLALLATNLILINKFYKFLCEAIKIRETIKSSKLNILNKIVRCKVKEEFQDLEFCCSINLKLIIEFVRSSNYLFIRISTSKLS